MGAQRPTEGRPTPKWLIHLIATVPALGYVVREVLKDRVVGGTNDLIDQISAPFLEGLAQLTGAATPGLSTQLVVDLAWIAVLYVTTLVGVTWLARRRRAPRAPLWAWEGSVEIRARQRELDREEAVSRPTSPVEIRLLRATRGNPSLMVQDGSVMVHVGVDFFLRSVGSDARVTNAVVLLQRRTRLGRWETLRDIAPTRVNGEPSRRFEQTLSRGVETEMLSLDFDEEVQPRYTRDRFKEPGDLRLTLELTVEGRTPAVLSLARFRPAAWGEANLGFAPRPVWLRSPMTQDTGGL